MDFKNRLKQEIDKIHDLYPGLKNLGTVWTLGLYESICDNQIINEFVSKTIPASKTIEEFNKRFKGFSKLKVDDDFDDDEGSIKLILSPDDYDKFEEINKFLDSFGYFPAFISEPMPKKYSLNNLNTSFEWGKKIHIRYESKYDTEIVNRENTYFHLIPDIYLEKVKLIGLTPRSKSKIANHPERIYLLNPDSMDEYEQIAQMLYEALPGDQQERIKKYYLLGIDSNDIKDIKLYRDPNFPVGNGAVWTYQNIPPKYIEVLDEINVY